jgi:hypothetical protein
MKPTSSWTIIIMAFSLSLALLSYVFFYKYRPALTEIAYAKDLADKQEQVANDLPKAKKNVEKAIAIVNEKTALWNKYVATRTPPTSVAAGGIDLTVSPLELVTDTYKFRDSIQKAVNAQVKAGGVKVLEPGPYVPAQIDPNYTGNLLSSFYHFPDFDFPVVLFDFGTVRVQGTYDQIMANVRSYKSMPHYLAVTDGLRIDGTSPHLIGTYQLSIVGFIRGTKIHAAIPEANTGSSGTGASGFPAGMPGMGGAGRGGPPMGSFPGMPGGMGGAPGGMPGAPAGGGSTRSRKGDD